MTAFTPRVLLQRFCTDCMGLDAECPSCSGLGFHASRAEIKNWRAQAESEIARARAALETALSAQRMYAESDDPERLFQSTHASMLFSTLAEMQSTLDADIRAMRAGIDGEEHAAKLWDRCLTRIDEARARRKEAERAERAEPEAPPPAPVETPTCSEPGCGRDAYATDEDGAPWCKRHAHARGLLQRDVVPESDPEPAEPLPEAGNASPQAPGRGYRFVGGPADNRVIEVPRGETEWEIEGTTYHRRGNAFVARR